MDAGANVVRPAAGTATSFVFSSPDGKNDGDTPLPELARRLTDQLKARGEI